MPADKGAFAKLPTPRRRAIPRGCDVAKQNGLLTIPILGNGVIYLPWMSPLRA